MKSSWNASLPPFKIPGWLHHILLIALTLCLFPAHAGTIPLDSIPDQSLGLHADFLPEAGTPLNLSEATTRLNSGEFRQSTQSVPNFGIGSPPVWLHLSIRNDSHEVVEKHLLAGVTWLDHVEVYVLNSGSVLSQYNTGDEIPNAPGLVAALGFALPLQFAPGDNDVFLRVDSIDPMAIPIQLVSNEKLDTLKLQSGYFYGLFYGFLSALFLYNLLLFFGLKERSFLYYSLALGSILACNFGYTGHGIAWVWPDQPGFQRYAILLLMVAFNILGLMFANRFLNLSRLIPKLWNVLKWFAGIIVSLVVISTLADSHLPATLTAFTSMGTFTTIMFLIGLLSVWKKQESGRYFLLAATFGMLGAATTAFAVWGQIPFNLATFHAAEIGLMAEAALLALALAYRMRQYQDQRHKAERLAQQDTLTGLNNRRGFIELATPSILASERYHRPLSLVVLDIDHFKSINDQYGHDIGDKALTAVASLLLAHSRASDIVARWGGEEFILLLPETTPEQSVSHTERLRESIAGIRLQAGGQEISLTASFGVAGYQSNLSLEELIKRADLQLYRAKESGRNRVCYAEPTPATATPHP